MTEPKKRKRRWSKPEPKEPPPDEAAATTELPIIGREGYYTFEDWETIIASLRMGRTVQQSAAALGISDSEVVKASSQLRRMGIETRPCARSRKLSSLQQEKLRNLALRSASSKKASKKASHV